MSTNPNLSTAQLRHRAEAQLRKHKQQQRTDAAKAQSSPLVLNTDSQRQFHELQVHQVELEMQNIELQKVREELEATLEQYTDLYDFAPVGYFTLAPDSTVQQVNLTGASLVKIERSRLVGRCFDQFFAAGVRPAFRAFLQQVFANPAKQSGDFEMLHPGKPLRAFNIKAQRSLHENSCRVAVVDITERKLAEDRVRVSEIRYRRLFETAHDGVLLLDPATRKITDANPFMTALLGYSHDQLMGKELFEIGLLKDESASQTMFQKLKRDHEVRYEDLPLQSKAGQHQEVEVVANLYQENGHSVIQCNIRDITKRKAAEIAINRLAAIVEFSEDGIIGKTPAGIITSWNQGAEKIFGYAAREIVGTSIMRLIPDDRRAEEKRILARIRNGKGIKHFETVRKTKSGRLIQASVTASPIRAANGKIVGVSKVVRDITERKQAEAVEHRVAVLSISNLKLQQEIVLRLAKEKSLKQSDVLKSQMLEQSHLMQNQLRHLSRQVLHAQEEERKRISRDLHDVIAQTLTSINTRLAALKNEASLDHKGFDRSITRTQKLVEHSVDIVHEFARELRPAMLDDLGLIPALHSFVKIFSNRTQLHVDLKAFAGVEQLDSNKRTILYRVAQEALNNVARHAKASRVKVSIQKRAGGISLKISDDGKSFNVARALPANGGKRLGLVGMRERVEMVGGKFSVISAPGQGTTIEAHLPLEKSAAKERGGHAASTSSTQRASKRAEGRAPRGAHLDTTFDANPTRSAVFTPIHHPEARRPGISSTDTRALKRPEGRAPGAAPRCAPARVR